MFKGTECSLTGWHPWKRMGAACFSRDCEWQWMPVRELWHVDAFAWGAGRKRARQPPTVQSFARPITPEEVDSESDDDDMEDDE